LIRLVDELHDAADISDGLWKVLTTAFSIEQIFELIALVGLYHTVSFFANGLRLGASLTRYRLRHRAYRRCHFRVPFEASGDVAAFALARNCCFASEDPIPLVPRGRTPPGRITAYTRMSVERDLNPRMATTRPAWVSFYVDYMLARTCRRRSF
jgi:hypothetical protein